MIFRGVWQLDGGHITMRVFVAKSHEHTFAGLGLLTMSEDDFESFKRSVARYGSRQPDTWEFRERSSGGVL